MRKPNTFHFVLPLNDFYLFIYYFYGSKSLSRGPAGSRFSGDKITYTHTHAEICKRVLCVCERARIAKKKK